MLSIGAISLQGCVYDPYTGYYEPYAYPAYGYYPYSYGYYPPVSGSVVIGGGWNWDDHRGWDGRRGWRR
ncbi:MAG TPA: hypothetical protein VFN42_10955 [Acetobacteraceae bacterium]|nr:hypothetical protein [Acetobacteraceae bacterium]